MATKPTKVYQALHPEHFSRSCPERDMGGVSHRWWGALCYLKLSGQQEIVGFFNY